MTGMSQFAQYFGSKSIDNDDAIESEVCVVNNRSWRRRELLNIRNGDSSVLSESDKEFAQLTHDKQTLVMIELDSYSICPLRAVKSNDTARIKESKSGTFVLENGLIHVEVLSNGVIRSLIHKQSGKEVIKCDANSDGIG